jgi:hypothetical protein
MCASVCACGMQYHLYPIKNQRYNKNLYHYKNKRYNKKVYLL